MVWDFFAWVGIVTLCVIALRCIHFAAESFIVSRAGWDHLSALGFWRSFLASLRSRLGDTYDGPHTGSMAVTDGEATEWVEFEERTP